MYKPGRYIKFAYFTAPGTSATSVSLYDPNGNTVTVQPWERLIIDTVTMTADDAGSSNEAYAVLFGGNTSDSFSAANMILDCGAFGAAGDGLRIADSEEGLMIPLGKGLVLIASDTTCLVRLSGTGRIVTDKTQGKQPPWKGILSPGQSVPTTSVIDP